MTKLIFVIVLIAIFFQPAFGALSDKTGLKNDFTVKTDGYEFEVITVSNFDIDNVQLNKEEKKLTFNTNSNLESNLAEIQIPANLIDGNLTALVNGKEIYVDIHKNEKISLVVLEFNGSGQNKIEIMGTTYLPEFSSLASVIMATVFASIIISKRFKKF